MSSVGTHLYLEEDWCPCSGSGSRRLAGEDAETWETVYVSVILFLMFVALISDRVGADSVMLTALGLFMVAEIITTQQALRGFSNNGILTVMILFVVAEGISRTGALDWYLGKILGSPKTAASAQLRLMIPVALISAFMNNTPIVTVMIPIVQRWAHNIGINQRQLLIPLSFASIFGGTCTLIGTSTNLVVEGLLLERYKGEFTIGLFDLGLYGVPIAMIGTAYTVLAAPYLLPDAKSGVSVEDDTRGILMGARLLPWSPAAGRTVKRSGLRDAGGIFLVSVVRAATGNIHRAVSSDFVLSAGDILYFTGLVEGFGQYCEEHGLEVLTNENEEGTVASNGSEAGYNEDSLLEASSDERLRSIVHLSDAIQNNKDDKPSTYEHLGPNDPSNIVVTVDRHLVVVGIDSQDRPDLLLDISKALASLGLHQRHTESTVVGSRSLSVWRCDSGTETPPKVNTIWGNLSALLSSESGIAALKEKGQRVLRALITPSSRLAGKVVKDIDFRGSYGAAIVAIQKGDHSIAQNLSNVRLNAGDAVILQVIDDSPLLQTPPVDFYKNLDKKHDGERSDVEASDTSISAEEAWRDLRVLAERASPSKEFLAVMEIANRSTLAGKTIVQSGISKLPDVFLVCIERPLATSTGRAEHQAVESLDPSLPLQPGDLLWFAGSAGHLGDLRKIPGLKSYENDEVKKLNEHVFDRRLVQAVISRRSPLVGKTVKEIEFRTRYGAAVIAVNRDGRRIHDHPGSIRLLSGDVLLLEAGSSFFANSGANNNVFALLTEVENSAPPRIKLLIPTLVIVAAMIVVFTAEFRPLIVVAILASVVLVSIGVMSEQEARDSVNWDIFIIVASAFGIGTALVNSGVAGGIADFLVDIGESFGIGDAGILGAVYFGTFLISNVVTNNAAAALLFPIAMDAADQSGVDRIKMSFAVMLGASASFMSPFGYTTNLLVYGPGGYKVLDFIKFGTPLHIVLLVASTAFLTVIEPWYISWIASAAILVLSALFQLGKELPCFNKTKEDEPSLSKAVSG